MFQWTQMDMFTLSYCDLISDYISNIKISAPLADFMPDIQSNIIRAIF